MSDPTPPPSAPTTAPHTVSLPRISITFCTQCRWMLRAAYFAQELLSTFGGTTLGEVALVPATGGVFQVHITYLSPTSSSSPSLSSSPDGGEVDKDAEKEVRTALLWDRKAEGGFPETKVLKQRVRDCIQPARDLGHSDVGGKKKVEKEVQVEKSEVKSEKCQDC